MQHERHEAVYDARLIDKGLDNSWQVLCGRTPQKCTGKLGDVFWDDDDYENHVDADPVRAEVRRRILENLPRSRWVLGNGVGYFLDGNVYREITPRIRGQHKGGRRPFPQRFDGAEPSREYQYHLLGTHIVLPALVRCTRCGSLNHVELPIEGEPP